ncbi:hypothetical protein HUJ04_012178 [Dendroctonus ponderosae]|nr:hypothetical protein HUJ04_012178 [Dendroctonus ponderosae]
MWPLKARKMSRSDDAQSQTGPKRLPSCLDIFTVKSVSSANFKYVKTQFHNGSCASVTNIEGGSKLNLQNNEHRYEKVSTPISCERNPQDQPKATLMVTFELIVWISFAGYRRRHFFIAIFHISQIQRGSTLNAGHRRTTSVVKLGFHILKIGRTHTLDPEYVEKAW